MCLEKITKGSAQQPYQKADLHFGASSSKKILTDALLDDFSFIKLKTFSDIVDIVTVGCMPIFRVIIYPVVGVPL